MTKDRAPVRVGGSRKRSSKKNQDDEVNSHFPEIGASVQDLKETKLGTAEAGGTGHTSICQSNGKHRAFLFQSEFSLS